MWDDGRSTRTSELVRAGVSDLGLSLELAPLPSSPLAALIVDGSFGGALLSLPITVAGLPRSVSLAPSAALSGFTDSISPCPPTAHNSRATALAATLAANLSPVNLVGRWSSAVVVDLSGRDARELAWALGSLGVRKLFAVRSEGLQGDEREVVPCEDLDEVVRSAGSRGPTIVVCGGEGVELPQGLRESSTGGVVLSLGGNAQREIGGWIGVGRDELELAAARACFTNLTGKRPPGISTV